MNHFKTSPNGISLIKTFEGLHDGDLTKIGLQPKMCPAGIWTEGYGHAMRNPNNGRFLKGWEDSRLAYALHSVNNEEDAVRLLTEDLIDFEKGVNSLVKVVVNQNQFDALTSFAFNVGLDIDNDLTAEGLGDSILLRKLNAGDFLGCSDEFIKWNKCNGQALAGLTRRRITEKILFLTPIAKQFDLSILDSIEHIGIDFESYIHQSLMEQIS